MPNVIRLRLPWNDCHGPDCASVTLDRRAGTITVKPPGGAPTTVPISDALRAVVAAGRTRLRSEVGKATAAGLARTTARVCRLLAVANDGQAEAVPLQRVNGKWYAPAWAVEIARLQQLPAPTRVALLRKAMTDPAATRRDLADALASVLLISKGPKERLENARRVAGED